MAINKKKKEKNTSTRRHETHSNIPRDEIPNSKFEIVSRSDVSATCGFRSAHAHRESVIARFYILFYFYFFSTSTICILYFDWWRRDRPNPLGVRPHRVPLINRLLVFQTRGGHLDFVMFAIGSLTRMLFFFCYCIADDMTLILIFQINLCQFILNLR